MVGAAAVASPAKQSANKQKTIEVRMERFMGVEFAPQEWA